MNPYLRTPFEISAFAYLYANGVILDKWPETEPISSTKPSYIVFIEDDPAFEAGEVLKVSGTIETFLAGTLVWEKRLAKHLNGRKGRIYWELDGSTGANAWYKQHPMAEVVDMAVEFEDPGKYILAWLSKPFPIHNYKNAVNSLLRDVGLTIPFCPYDERLSGTRLSLQIQSVWVTYGTYHGKPIFLLPDTELYWDSLSAAKAAFETWLDRAPDPDVGWGDSPLDPEELKVLKGKTIRNFAESLDERIEQLLEIDAR